MAATRNIALISAIVLAVLLINSLVAVRTEATSPAAKNNPRGSSSQSDLTPTVPNYSGGLSKGTVPVASSATASSSSSSESWKTLPFLSEGHAVKIGSNVNVTESGSVALMRTVPVDSNANIVDVKQGLAQGNAGTSDGYCFASIVTCGNVVLNQSNAPVMHQATFVIDVWAGCGSSSCYNTCNGQHLFETGGGNAADCHYIFLQERYFEDFCAEANLGQTGLFALMNQYTDNSGTGLSSCSLLGGSTTESNGGFTVSYVYDGTPFPNDGTKCSGVTPCLNRGDIQQSAARMADYVGSGCVKDGTHCEVLVLLPFNTCQDGFCPTSNPPNFSGGFCAYHSWFQYQSGFSTNTLSFADMPAGDAAGATCAATNLTPTGDETGDLEVSFVSHESDETISDPLLNAYNFPAAVCNNTGCPVPGNVEIGDECAYDFRELEPDHSTVHMGGDAFRIQPEWSNANNGCSFDLSGAPVKTTIVLQPDTSTGTPAAWPTGGFPVRFQEAGEGSSGFTTVSLVCNNLGCSAGGSESIVFFVTPDGAIGFNNLSIDSVLSSPDELWCLALGCFTQFGAVSSTTTLTFTFYDLLLQHPLLCLNPLVFNGLVICGGSAASFQPSFCYQAPPSSGGSADSTQVQCFALGGDIFGAFAVRGSQASWDNCSPLTLVGKPPFLFLTCGSSAGERWSTGGPCHLFLCSTSATITSVDTITNLFYWDQFTVTSSYSVHGGGSPTAPSLAATQFGSSFITTLSSSPAVNWLDSGASWSITNPLVGSGSAERWETNAVASGMVTTAMTLAPAYYHQFDFTLNYLLLGGGAPAAPLLASGQFGAVYHPFLTSASTQYWLDNGASWSITNPLIGSGASERWQTTSSISGTVSSALTSTLNYYHQFFVPVSFFVSDASTAPSNPTLTSSSFGGPITQTMLTTPASLWLDGGASWSATTVLSGTTSTERWFASTSSGTVTSASIIVEYFHQYFVTFNVVVVGHACSSCGGTTSPSTGWQNAGSNITITATPNSASAFASWTISKGLITIGDSGSATTTALINGPGTITVRFRPLH